LREEAEKNRDSIATEARRDREKLSVEKRRLTLELEQTQKAQRDLETEKSELTERLEQLTQQYEVCFTF